MKNIIIYLTLLLLLMGSAYAVQIATDNFECNAFNCGTGWNGAWSYSGTCEIVTLSGPIGTYHLRAGQNCNALRTVDVTTYSQVNVSFYATASSLESGEYCRYYYWNGTGNKEILALTDGQDDGIHDYYNFIITSYGLNANSGIRVIAPTTTGDYCYIDNIVINGFKATQLSLFTNARYIAGTPNQTIEMSSSLTNTVHTLELRENNNNLYCIKNITSPSISGTTFSTQCNIPPTPQTNAYFKLYVTSSPGSSITKYFNITVMTQDASKINIEKVYFSPQVLQGGSTEIYALIKNTTRFNTPTIKLSYPDMTTRTFYMLPTPNSNEYKAFITDTYQIGNMPFLIRVEGDTTYAQYSNSYIVAAYNVDFVEVVNKVAEVAVCKKVEEIPQQEIQVFGTEYRQGDKATVFLQLKDDQGLPENDGNCYLDIYYPLDYNLSHQIYLDDAPMLYLSNSDGVYYYDIPTLPNLYGVYMMTATCSYSLLGSFVYSIDGAETNYPTRITTLGTYTGSTIFLNDYEDWIYTKCASSGGATKSCDAYYDFNTTIHTPDLTNITNINLYYMGEASIVLTAQFYYWNWTSSTWKLLPNALTYSGGSTNPLGIGDFSSNSIPLANSISNDGIIRIRVLQTSGVGFTVYDNWLNIGLQTKTGIIHDLKGSSEIHINDWFSNYTSLISDKVWTWHERNLTTQYPAELNITTLQDVGTYVWQSPVRNLTYTPPATLNLTALTNIANTVWTRTMRNLTYTPPATINSSTMTAIASKVWINPVRNLTYINTTEISKSVWSYLTRNLTYIPAATLNTTTLDYIGNYVWWNPTRNLTYINSTHISYSVWNYSAKYINGEVI